MQIVITGEVEIGAINLPHGGDFGRTGKIAVRSKNRVLIAQEADHSGLL